MEYISANHNAEQLKNLLAADTPPPPDAEEDEGKGRHKGGKGKGEVSTGSHPRSAHSVLS